MGWHKGLLGNLLPQGRLPSLKFGLSLGHGGHHAGLRIASDPHGPEGKEFVIFLGRSAAVGLFLGKGVLRFRGWRRFVVVCIASRNDWSFLFVGLLVFQKALIFVARHAGGQGLVRGSRNGGLCLFDDLCSIVHLVIIVLLRSSSLIVVLGGRWIIRLFSSVLRGCDWFCFHGIVGCGVVLFGDIGLLIVYFGHAGGSFHRRSLGRRVFFFGFLLVCFGRFVWFVIIIRIFLHSNDVLSKLLLLLPDARPFGREDGMICHGLGVDVECQVSVKGQGRNFGDLGRIHGVGDAQQSSGQAIQ